MDAEQALHAVQAALEAHSLPGSVGLRTADRTFLVALRPADSKAADAVADVLEAMGMEVSVNGMVFGKLTGKLLPAPPAVVTSADSSSAAEGAALTGLRRCADCLQRFPVETFTFINRSTGRRCSYCRDCEHRRQKRARVARTSSRPASR
jgi:hypothetical protein